jgi:hypothetical protein
LAKHGAGKPASILGRIVQAWLLCCPGMVIAPDPYILGVAPVRAEAGKLYFTKVARLLLDSRSEHPRGLASLASALGSGEHVDSPRILEVLYISIEY